MLLENGADVNAFNCAGDRPIHYAVSEGHFDIIKKVFFFF